MKRLPIAALAALCSAILPRIGFAQQPIPPAEPSGGIPYIGIAGAYSLLDDVHVHPMDEPQSPGRARERFGDGFASALVLGYALGNGFAVELEGAYDYNNVINLVPTAPPGKQTGHQESFGGFVNGAYTFDLPKMGMDVGFMKPYVGVGVGALSTHVTLPIVAQGDAFVNHIGGTSGPNFAYQGFVGAAFPISAVPGLAAFSDYRLIGVNNPDKLTSNFYTSSGLSKGLIKLSPAFVNLFTVGLVYGFGGPPPAPKPLPVMASAPAVAPSRTYLVFFDWDHADLSARATQIIGEAAAASTHVQVTRIEVNGYTDLSGTASYNQGLSVRRAQAVQGALIRDGVAAKSIVIKGFGETHPLVPTAEGVREPQNRRVEIILH